MNPASERKPVIILRHGLFSNGEALRPVQVSLERNLGTVIDVDNETYDWERGILENAALLTRYIAERYPSRRIILIGHSMGGLLARCTNLALSLPGDTARFSTIHAGSLTGATLRPLRGAALSILSEYEMPPDVEEYRAAAEQVIALGDAGPKVVGVITIATPNSGAITASQVASFTNLSSLWNVGKAAISGNPVDIARAVAEQGQGIAKLFVRGAYGAFNLRMASVKDITSDRLFRFFQLFELDTACVTISGSFGNYLAAPNATGSLVKFSGVDIQTPHDGVVQDDSVDLGESILPHEFRHHTHHRRYRDCTDAHHCDIYAREAVLEIVRNTVRAWVAR